MNTPTYVMAVPWEMARVKTVKMLVQEQGAKVTWDQKRSVMDTFTRMLESAGDGPGIFLQDDIELHPKWREKVEEAISQHPETMIQFFSLRDFKPEEIKRGLISMAPGTYLSNLCYYLPEGQAAELLEYTRKWAEERPESNADDWAVRDWLKSRKQRYLMRVPNLVQHQVLKSSINSRSSKRQSPTFGME